MDVFPSAVSANHDDGDLYLVSHLNSHSNNKNENPQ